MIKRLVIKFFFEKIIYDDYKGFLPGHKIKKRDHAACGCAEAIDRRVC